MPVATPDRDPFELWCLDNDIDENDRATAFGRYVEETTGWTGQTFSLSEEERHWITRANEIVEWLRVAAATLEPGAHHEAIDAAFRCLTGLKPMPGSLTIE